MSGIVRLNQFPEGSGNLTNDDIFMFMDSPSSGGVTKKVSLDNIKSIVTANIDGGEANILYFYSPLPTSFNDLDAWYLDETHKIPSPSLPTSNDLVVILTGNNPNDPGTLTAKFVSVTDNSVDGSMRIYGTIFAQKCYFYADVLATSDPSNIGIDDGMIHVAIHANCEFAGYASLGQGSVYGNCVFNNNSATLGTVIINGGDCTFNNNSTNYGNVTGNCTFNDNTFVYGSITGNCIFNDNTSIGSSMSITGNVTFNDQAWAGGTLYGDCTFNDFSKADSFVVNGDCTCNDYSHTYISTDGWAVNGSCTFNDFSGNGGGLTISGTNNSVTFNDNFQVTGGLLSVTADSILFNDNSNANGASMTGGSVTFNNSSENSMSIIADSVTFNHNSSMNNAFIYGDVTFNNNSSMNNAFIYGDVTFNNNSSMYSGNIGNTGGDPYNATFNDNSNYYGGIISGTKTCNTTGFCASLWFYADPPTSFDDLTAWYTDSAHTIPASGLPTSTDDVVIFLTNYGVYDGDLTANKVFVTNPASPDYREIMGTITADCIFNDNVVARGNITGNCTFNDLSAPRNPTINGHCTWNDYSNTTNIYESSYNTINGGCTFNDFAGLVNLITINATNNSVTFNDNTFNSDNNFNNFLIINDADVVTFNDECVIGGYLFIESAETIFNDTSQLSALGPGNTINSNVTFNDNSSIGFNVWGASISVNGNATFNDNSSYYGGTINGAITRNTTGFCASMFFNGTSYNDLASWYTDDAMTIPASGLPTSTDDVVMRSYPAPTGTLTVNNIYTDEYPFSGTITGNCLILQTIISATITGDVTFVGGANQGTITGDVTFFGGANQGTITGDVTFSSGNTAIGGTNQGTITGRNVTFNDGSAMVDGTITGKVTFNDNSEMVDGTINGRAIFNDDSTLTGGTVTGAVICNTTSTCSSI